MGQRKSKQVGDIYNSDKYGKFEILNIFKRNNRKRAEVKFLDTGYHTTIGLSEIKENVSIKDKFSPTVCGKGFIGDFEYIGLIKRDPIYKLWYAVLTRCYDEKFHIKQPTYKDCYMGNEWLGLVNFSNDLEHILGYNCIKDYPNIQFDLDKDILFNGNKEYSMDKCCFVPHAINMFIACHHRTNTSGYEGVSYNKNAHKYIAYISINDEYVYLGLYDKAENAHEEYKKAKMDRLLYYIDVKYKFLDKRIKQGLLKAIE